MLQVRIKGNFKGIEKKLNQINNDFNSGNFFLRLAKLLNSSIQQRVQRSGKNADGSTMGYISRPYIDFRSSRGRQIRFKDLTFSGKMWQSLTASAFTNGAKMFFGAASSAAKAAGNNARSKFFDIGENEQKIIQEELRKINLR